LKTKLKAKETVLDGYKELQDQMQASIHDLTLTEEANNRTIDGLRNIEKLNILIIQELREELIQIKGKISAPTISEDENKAFIKQLRDKQKQFLDIIDKQTNTEETNNWIIKALLDKQTKNQMVEAIKHMVPCLTQHRDVSTRKVEAITTSKLAEIPPAINVANFWPNNLGLKTFCATKIRLCD
jgi:hypothetical protein